LERKESGRGFSPAVVRAFRRLAEYVREEQLLVTTTARLLDLVRSRSKAAQIAGSAQTLDASASEKWRALEYPVFR
jgi:hypothetical protein